MGDYFHVRLRKKLCTEFCRKTWRTSLFRQKIYAPNPDLDILAIKHFHQNKMTAVAPYVEAAKVASAVGLGINAGHDLDLRNLAYLKQSMPFLDEVSIGHALICDALYLGLENTIQLYLRALK